MATEGVRRYSPLSDGGVRLELTPTTTSPLAINGAESAEMRVQRLITENPLIIFTGPACCMCHVMKTLLANIGVHPTVIELAEDEIADGGGAWESLPALYIGGACVGNFESLVALHLSENLVPRLVQAGALGNQHHFSS